MITLMDQHPLEPFLPKRGPTALSPDAQFWYEMYQRLAHEYHKLLVKDNDDDDNETQRDRSYRY